MECRNVPGEGPPPGTRHQFAFFSTTTQRISKISVSMKSSVHVLSKYEGITMFEFLKFDTWANNRHIGCTFVVLRGGYTETPGLPILIVENERFWHARGRKNMKIWKTLRMSPQVTSGGLVVHVGCQESRGVEFRTDLHSEGTPWTSRFKGGPEFWG